MGIAIMQEIKTSFTKSLESNCQRLATLAEALKKLEEAELKVKALNTLIDVAEEQFKIAIRKKAGARQSKE